MPEAADRIEGEFSRLAEKRVASLFPTSHLRHRHRSRAKIVLRFRNVRLLQTGDSSVPAGLVGPRSVLRGNSNITHSSSCPFSPRNSTQSFMPFLSRILIMTRISPGVGTADNYNWEGAYSYSISHMHTRPTFHAHAHSLTYA